MVLLMNKRLPTVWLRNTSTGQKKKVNAADYASDLGQVRWKGWEIFKEQRGDPPSNEQVSGESIGVTAKVEPEEIAQSEQIAVGSREEAEERSKDLRRRENRRQGRRQPDVEVKDKEPEG